MKLTADNVSEVFLDCMFRPEEVDEEGNPKITPVVVSGLIHNFGFHPKRLARHQRDIRTMLMELPGNFFVSIGGGWSFLNLCQKEDGEMWTGLHQTCEQLACLAIGSGYGEWVPGQRSLWEKFPGGVPYFQVDLNKGEGDDGSSARD